MKRLLIVIALSFTSVLQPQDKGSFTGTVIDSISKNPIINCNISVKKLNTGTVSDEKGNFRLELDHGKYEVHFSHLNYSPESVQIILTKENPHINSVIFLRERTIESKEVTVTDKRIEPSTIVQELEKKDIERIPSIYNDVLRTVQILPGVTSNSELNSGFNVRGGNYDENIIYLNGYEIFRPFFLREGIEESQTIINRDLVQNLKFYNGGFSASLGDKMSSVLQVDYDFDDKKTFGGGLRGSLLNMGLALWDNSSDKFNWMGGIRYSYPGLFLDRLHTSGTYSPFFADIQFLFSNKLTEKSELETFLLYSKNDYELIPSEWIGHFKTDRATTYSVSIDYTGERKYDFSTKLAAVKYQNNLNRNMNLQIKTSFLNMIESDYSDLKGTLNYIPFADSPDEDREYLKTEFERVNNHLDLKIFTINPEINYVINNHNFYSGFDIKISKLKSVINEDYYDTGDSSILRAPLKREIQNNFDLSSFAYFIEDDISFNSSFRIKPGARFLYYIYNEEILISPRISFSFYPHEKHSLNFNWGFYYQPPFYNELKNKEENRTLLKSQRAIHYLFGWEYKFKEKVKFLLEAYYKDLDNILPFYFEDQRIVYLQENSRKGYAYGIDLMFQGEIVEGMNSWIGYGYLDSKEKEINSSADYQRRLLDQTHTIQVFLQDRMRKLPNWQSHFRFLVGSGYLYYIRRLENDPVSGRDFISVDVNKPREYFLDLRADMGLSVTLDILKNYKMVITGEVLNLFNHYNYGEYFWIQALKDYKQPLQIPNRLSKRFFNLQVEVKF